MRILLTTALLLASSSAAAQEAPAAPAAPPPSGSSWTAPTMEAPPPVPRAPALEPSSGLWWLLGGSALTIAGVANLATAPLCTLSAIRSSAQPACIGTSIAFGVGLLAAGIPLVVVGASKRAAWLEWSKGSRVGVAPAPGGAAATWLWTF